MKSIQTARLPFFALSILFVILLIQKPLQEAVYNTLYAMYVVFSFLFFMSLALGQYTKAAFFGWLLGSVGMLLSVPLTMIVKIALESREESRWLAVLLSSDDDLKPVEKAPVAES